MKRVKAGSEVQGALFAERAGADELLNESVRRLKSALTRVLDGREIEASLEEVQCVLEENPELAKVPLSVIVQLKQQVDDLRQRLAALDSQSRIRGMYIRPEAASGEGLDGDKNDRQTSHWVFVDGERLSLVRSSKEVSCKLGDEVIIAMSGQNRILEAQTDRAYRPSNPETATLLGLYDGQEGQIRTLDGTVRECLVAAAVAGELTQPDDFPVAVAYDAQAGVATSIARPLPSANQVTGREELVDFPTRGTYPDLDQKIQRAHEFALTRFLVAKANDLLRESYPIDRLKSQACMLLFAGPVGTGKTTASQVLVSTLDRVQRLASEEVLTIATESLALRDRRDSSQCDPVAAARRCRTALQATLDQLQEVLPGIAAPEAPSDPDEAIRYVMRLADGARLPTGVRRLRERVEELKAQRRAGNDGVNLKILRVSDVFRPFVGEGVIYIQACGRDLRKSNRFGMLCIVEADPILKERRRVVSSDVHQEIVTAFADLTWGTTQAINYAVAADTNIIDMIDPMVISRSIVSHFEKPRVEHFPAMIRTHLTRKLGKEPPAELQESLADCLLSDVPLVNVETAGTSKLSIGISARPFVTPRFIAKVVDQAGQIAASAGRALQQADLLLSTYRELDSHVRQLNVENLREALSHLPSDQVPESVARAVGLAHDHMVSRIVPVLDLDAQIARLQEGDTRIQ